MLVWAWLCCQSESDALFRAVKYRVVPKIDRARPWGVGGEESHGNYSTGI